MLLMGSEKCHQIPCSLFLVESESKNLREHYRRTYGQKELGLGFFTLLHEDMKQFDLSK